MLLDHRVLEHLLASCALYITGVLVTHSAMVLELTHVDLKLAYGALKLPVLTGVVMLLKTYIIRLFPTPLVAAHENKTFQKLLDSPWKATSSDVALAQVRAHVWVLFVEFVEASVTE